MVIKILDTRNKTFRFWGTTSNYYKKDEVKERWDLAFTTLLELSGKEPERIREYLDSRLGRYFLLIYSNLYSNFLSNLFLGFDNFFYCI